MKISDLMQTDLATIAADASLGEALTMLVDAHVLALPALDAHGKFIGVLSTSDLLEALAERRNGGVGALLGDTRVEDLMTPQPSTWRPTMTSRRPPRRCRTWAFTASSSSRAISWWACCLKATSCRRSPTANCKAAGSLGHDSTRVSGMNTAQANQKWLPWGIGSSRRPASGPLVARPKTFQVDPVSPSR